MSNVINANEVKGSLPANVAADLDAFGVSPSVRIIIEMASTHTRITSNLVSGDYVSISPSDGGYIASFIHQERLTVAMPPAKAQTVGATYGWNVESGSGVTSFLKIPSTGLVTEAQRSVAATLLVDAVRWRASGPRAFASNAEPGVTGAATTQTCPRHYTEMLGGRCHSCDS